MSYELITLLMFSTMMLMQISYIIMGMFLDDKAMAPKEISLMDIYGSIIPFVIIMCFGLVIIMVFPRIALWLPNLYYGK